MSVGPELAGAVIRGEQWAIVALANIRRRRHKNPNVRIGGLRANVYGRIEGGL